MKQLTLDVAGMSCGHCVHAVRDALGSLDGVRVEDVKIGSATVAFDESRVAVRTLVDAIADAGYEATEAV